MVTIATFNEPDKAKRLKQRFQEAGIKADIHNEGHLQQMAFMSRPQANAKIMVDDADFERGQNLMIEWETTDPDVAAAQRIEFPIRYLLFIRLWSILLPTYSRH